METQANGAVKPNQLEFQERCELSNTERCLMKMDLMMKKAGIEYFVIGSVARNAYMGKPISRPEIDILFTQQERQPEAFELINELKAENPEVEFDTTLSGLLKKGDGGKYYLEKGSIVYELDPQVLETQRIRTTGGIEFSTLPPETLLHTFILAGSNFRTKDWENALTFGRWIREQVKKENIKYDHTLLLPFHQFAHDQLSRSPLKAIQFKWRRLINNLPPELRNLLLGKIYQNPIFSLTRRIFNTLEEATCGIKT